MGLETVSTATIPESDDHVGSLALIMERADV